MAQQFLSINRGQFGIQKVLTATSAPTADVYLQISNTNNPTREDVLLALREINNFILSNGIQSGTAGTNLPPK